jgi:hypothetical protein
LNFCVTFVPRASRSAVVNRHVFSAESIYRAYGLCARVVYLGVDVEKFRPLDLPRENFVLSVAVSLQGL